jgi:hypothetical protein
MPDIISLSRLVPHGLPLCRPHPSMGTGEPLMTADYKSTTQLAAALKRAADARHQYEQSTGKPDADWSTWYAEYILEGKHHIWNPEDHYDTRPLMD